MNGGASLTVAGRPADVIYRDLEVVEHWVSEASEGRFEIDAVDGWLAGMPTYVLVAELASCEALMLMDAATTEDPKASQAGRINVNLAPRAILEGLPGMTEEILENLLTRRVEADASEEGNSAWSYATWMLSEGVVTLDEMRELLPLVNAGGDVYRAQIVRYFDDGQAASRVEAVFDATGPLPRLLSWRDISHLGRGYDLVTLGLDEMSMQRSSVAR